MCKYVYGILLVVGIIVSCAKEGFPPGGPPDTFPPYVMDTIPSTGSTEVPLTITPVITFNERMDFRSIEESIFIVPFIPFEIESNWGGDAFTLRFKRPLADAQTYVITVGTGARDIRGNRLAGSAVFAIATGPEIDSGGISGVVALGNRQVVGAYIWAYNLRTTPTPDPVTTPPDYIVQAGQNGRFAFSNLSPGQYRVFAFLDRGRDRRYNPDQDPLGVPTSDVMLTPERSRVMDRRLELAVRDTVPLALLSVRVDDATHLRLRFSRPVSHATLVDSGHYRIIDLTSATPLSVLAAYRDPVDSASVALVSMPQTSKQAYTLTVTDLLDAQDRPIDPAGSTALFTGSGTPDTTPPTLRQVIPADSAVNVPLPLEIRLTFSEAVRIDSGAVTLHDPSGQMIGGTIRQDSPVLVRLYPASALHPYTGYSIMVHTSRIRDWSDNPMNMQDSVTDTILSRFTTVDPAVYGLISGKVSDDDSTTTGIITVTLTNIENTGAIYKASIPVPGAYRFGEVLPGPYIVSAYRDKNSDGRFSPGNAIPFVPAERTTARTDTVMVRSGWESEQVDLRFWP